MAPPRVGTAVGLGALGMRGATLPLGAYVWFLAVLHAALPNLVTDR